MKHYLGLAIAAIIIGFGVFSILYWGIKFSYAESLTLGLVICFTGFIVELLRPLILKLAKKKQSD